MKLKKIASLMLAGVMAVSMLAGCSGKTEGEEKPGDDVTVVPETGIVAAANNGQDASNDVKVNFTSDSSLDAALSSAVKAYGEYVSNNNLQERVSAITGINNVMTDVTRYTGTNYGVSQPVLDGADGVDVERVSAFVVNDALNEDVAMQTAVKMINDDIIADAPATSYKKGTTKGGEKYCDYSYTGSISMVTVEKANGTTVYCFAYTITQSTSVKTLAPAEA